MRGYYYDQTGEAPRSTPAPISAGRRRRWSAQRRCSSSSPDHGPAGGLTAAAGLWSHSRLEELPALADSTWQPPPSRSGGAAGGNHGRAGPTGDGTTLTISPLPSGRGPQPPGDLPGEHRLHRQHPGSKGGGMSLGTGVVMSEDAVYHHQ